MEHSPKAEELNMLAKEVNVHHFKTTLYMAITTPCHSLVTFRTVRTRWAQWVKQVTLKHREEVE
jgi:hypothetical protein